MLLRVTVLLASILGVVSTGASAHAQQVFRRIKSDIRELARSTIVRKKVHTGQDNEMELLARELDWLEAHMDKFGSVVAKQPDIWGESRLTKFRSEYENEMSGQLDQFTLRNNASISRQDIAAFTSATGVSAGPAGSVPPVNASVTNNGAGVGVGGEEGSAGANVTITTPSAALPVPRFTAETNLDVTEELNQRSRYINHLQQLRRINSGDDTSDAPGYSLNLVRIPISITPGRETNRSYGAKVTITAKPYTSNTLLPETFQSLVINDVVDQLALPILKAGENPELNEQLEEISLIFEFHRCHRRIVSTNEPPPFAEIEVLLEAAKASMTKHPNTAMVSASFQRQQTQQIEKYQRDVDRYQDGLVSPDQILMQTIEYLEGNLNTSNICTLNSVSRRRRTTLPIPQALLPKVIAPEDIVILAGEFVKSYSGQMVAWNQRNNAPPIHLADMRHYLQSNLEGAYRMLSTTANRQIVSNIIEGQLADAIQSADIPRIQKAHKDFIEQIHTVPPTQPDGFPAISPIMHRFAWPIVVEMALLNEQLNKDVHNIAVTRGDCGCHPSRSFKYYLSMPEDHQATQLDTDFLEAAEQFQNYVECRWPIHVFHVDPVNEDQNVQAASSISRQLAIAAAVGVSNGTLNFQQANQFTRNYREEINTIALNRTISGFSHSNDTFGWTFRPRVQIQPNRGNIAALGETLFGRKADANQRDAALEPGMRECTAVVLMPSFVPYCDFDISTSWFRLDNPRRKEITNHQTLKLSRSVKFMQDCAVQCANSSHLYRDGEVKRLLNRVEQLERELPLQSMRVQVPYENTLGGFELFSNGVSDLAPELVGWYGAPGIGQGAAAGSCADSCQSGSTTTTTMSMAATSNMPMAAAGSGTTNTPPAPQATGTTLFLVGDNFSVHETQIVAGGVAIAPENQTMISRQVIQVTVPACARTVELVDGNLRSEYVAIYAATPYGVTSHLHIPVFNPDATPPPAPEVASRVAAVESRLAPYRWENPRTLPIVSSLVPDAPGGPVRRTNFELAAIALNTNFTLRWTPPPASPIGTAGPTQAGLMGTFVINGETVGPVFWIQDPAGGNPIDLRTGTWSFTAEQLMNLLSGAITSQLTTAKTGDASPFNVVLRTWIVPGQNAIGTLPFVPQTPVAIDQEITIQLNRRAPVTPEMPPMNVRLSPPAPSLKQPVLLPIKPGSNSRNNITSGENLGIPK